MCFLLAADVRNHFLSMTPKGFLVEMCNLLMANTHTPLATMQGNEDETQQSQTQPPSGEDKGEDKGEDNTNEVLWADFRNKGHV
jgi:hypothetical protein